MAGAAVVLPQAMAFGVALFVPLGLTAAQGALAGLIGAACLSLVSGLFGGTVGLISSPTGPSLALLSGAMTGLAASAGAGTNLLTALIVLTALAGIVQIVIAVSGGAGLIRFIPHPVVAGFMTGAGLLMIKSQIGPLSGAGLDAPWHAWWWAPAVVAAVTFALVHYVPRFLPAVPGTIAGLVGGTLAFQGLALLGPAPVPAGWIIGSLPGPGSIHLGFDVHALHTLPVFSVFTSALALAMLASLNTLLTSVIADVTTGLRHNARRELLAQGAAQALTGLLGGMGGSATTGATVVSVRSGGRRWSGATTGAMFVLLVLLFGPVGHVIPISALSGIILYVSISLLDWDLLAWLRRKRTRTDAGIAILVTLVTVAYNLVAAIGVGVFIAIIAFIHAQVIEPVIHRRTTNREHRSVRQRSGEQRRLLDEHADRIVLYELRGNLFFAKADQLFEQLIPDLDRRAWVILHMRRVSQVDLTGIKILQQMAQRLAAHGGELLFCEVHKGIGMGHKVQKTMRKVSAQAPELAVRTFNGSDEALEYAEDALLTELGVPPTPPAQRVSVAETDVCRSLTPEQVAALELVLKPRPIEAGEHLFHAGQAGRELYIVVQGEIEIRLPISHHHYKRLAIYGPGMLFGEIAFLDPGPRTADGVAVHASEVMMLDRPGFDLLVHKHPDTAIALLMALGASQAHSLRWSAEKIFRLSQW